ncbi:MAG TPA: sugar ABC transporter substrate-binding protein, partial [Chloroflexota bacterium]|nr:sugar ABC transporter substrate-binding protein [Chloroflexota bacterium]
ARSSWRLLALGALVVLLTGWHSSRPAHAPITITYWTYQQSAKSILAATDAALKTFERQNPGTIVKATVFPYPVYRDKLLVAVKGGRAPDIATLDQIWTSEFAASGNIVPLDAYIAKSRIVRPSAFFKGAWASATYRGHVWGVPQSDDVWEQLYYNKDMFARAGLTHPPRTWAELLADGKKLTHAPSQYGLALLGHQGEDTICTIDSFIYSNGGRILNSDGTKAVINQPAAVQAIKFYQSLAAIAPAGTTNRAETDAASLFTAGKVAMTLDGSWQQDTYTLQGGAKLHWGVAVPPAPSGKVFHGCLGGWNMAIFKQSPHPDAAWKLVQYLGEKGPQMAVSAITPARLDAALQFIKMQRVGANVLLTTIQTGIPRPLSPIYPQISTIEQTMVQNIFLGMSAQKAADKAASDMDTAIQQQ